MSNPHVLDALRQALPQAALTEAPSIDMPTLYVDRDHILDVCRRLRDDPSLQFALLAEVTAVDLIPAEPLFEVVYHVACIGEAYKTSAVGPGAGRPTSEVLAAPPRRLRLKVRVPRAEASVPSVTSVWPAAGWLEREVFDLFGIAFEGHPDLRRILMPEDWQGYPLRRDYPVQIKKEAAAWSPIQLTAEQFAENIRAQREQAREASRER
jgi:NADH-quinone oxidoreductase subunit C